MSRRHFLELGAAGIGGLGSLHAWAAEPGPEEELAAAVGRLEFLTREENFVNIGRGKPPPHELPVEKRRAVGLLRETWRLEVVADPESDSRVERPLSREEETALDWPGLMKLAEKHAVRFMHVISCTNGNRPFGMGLWEGVPLREVLWLARPTANVRRVFYYGYHNDDPQQRFQSSLSLDRVLEDPPGELPVLLCYKLNGDWLTPKRGAPIRMLVPGAYGNKSVKWLQRVLLTNNPQLNDTYAIWNNDTESQLKTCAFFVHTPSKVRASRPIPIVGLAQVGMSGLRGLQCWLQPQDVGWPKDDPYFTRAVWQEAQILPPPKHWGGGLPEGRLPEVPLQIDLQSGQPRQWPMRNTIVYWKILLPGVKSGKYHLRCRTIDANGMAQPMPRPLLKSGMNAIQKVALEVEG